MYRKLHIVVFLLLVDYLCGMTKPTHGQTLAANFVQKNEQEEGKSPTSISLSDALDKLSKNYDVNFEFNDRLMKDKVVNTKLLNGNENLDKKLRRILAPLSLKYERFGKNSYVIFEQESTGRPGEKPQARNIKNESILSPVNVEHQHPNLAQPSIEQTETSKASVDIHLKGIVSDEKGDPLPGVSVIMKGTQQGTITDTDGKYSLDVPHANVQIVFSFVGYLPQEVRVGGRTLIDIVLKQDTKALEEVVVVGYGSVKKSDLTGSVAKVSEANIKATPIASLDRAMQGRAAGVQVVSNSARPGGSSTIRIRGSGSVNAGNDPLYVIDGFPTGNLNSINTDDVESIEILKDASATAIYGSRGANGVILVTTKRGKAGKTGISYDGYYGSQSVRNTIDLLNARQFAELVNEAQVNNGGKPYFDGSSADKPLPATLGEGTNWQEAVMRNAPIQSHQLSVSGGTEKSRYAISFGYFGQDGIILNSSFKRYTLRANLDNDLNSKIKVGLSMQGAYTTGSNARTEVDGNAGGGIISSALSYSPTFPIWSADGSYFKNQGTLNGLAVDNPLALANEFKNKATTIRILANSYIDYKIIEGLDFRTSFGADLIIDKANNYITRQAIAGASLGGSGVVSNSQDLNWLNENTLHYSRQLSPRHSLSALLGYTIQGLYVESVTARANTFSDDFAEYNNLGAGSTLVAPSTGASEWSLISYIARVNYGFDDRFLATFTARRDGSSRFGPDRKFGIFPSGALAWKIANEKWVKNISAVSDAKLRVSYGLSGNQDIGNYRYLANIISTPYVLGGTLYTGSATAGIANPDLRWEKNAQFDAGFDISLFNNRIQLSADYYIKNTSDLLFNVGVPTSSGFSSTLKNIGSVRNSGFEFSFNTINVDKGGFRWSSEFNVTFNKNKILTLDGRQEFRAGGDATIHNTSQNPILLHVGSPLGDFFGLVTDGIFQNQGEVDASSQKSARPGDLRYRDLNGDGAISDLDRDIIGNSNPDFFGGFNNTLSFKGFDLNFFLQGSYGNEILNYGTFDLLNMTGGNNQSAKALQRWTPTNPSNSVPRANAAGGSRLLSSLHIENGSYLRLKNISFGYNLPKSWLNRVSVGSAKVYVTLQNYMTFTRYSGLDPEVNRYGSSSLSQGLDYGAYPAAKTILAGINLEF
ncbi:SusC/RagA family TonB-linked outer membrane protein [Dyadobacter endophyticus]|uniref:SusC/RagA family TonB-linked outer membrane protein n=1 Tax=Dyadobacter endophyticus TaxID=1749036 RepID=A0ABQ1YE32_9BACT|nr:SusC/RagA family TonB-linked outer membrane protein [Dyadobacter endophyticus]GGH21037.1 SusC/RagA family TonB-linked outer membrane protein [Dyadobacter endophyticus]